MTFILIVLAAVSISPVGGGTVETFTVTDPYLTREACEVAGAALVADPASRAILYICAPNVGGKET